MATLGRLLRRAVDVREHETAALVASCAYFFFVLSAYYVIRPIRDEMGVAAGVEHLAWLFTGTLAGMLAVVALSALGAAADPATGRAGTEVWTNWHLFAAFAGILFIAWTYFVAWNNIAANHAIIERLVAEVQRVRQERGLESAKRPDFT